MVDLTQGINEWVRYTPKYTQRLKDGSIFDNMALPVGERISAEIRILNHDTRASYLATMKAVQNLTQLNTGTLEAKRNILEDNIRNVKNLKAGKRKIKNGKDILETQTDVFVQMFEDRIMGDLPLMPDEFDEEGELVKEGDEKN